MRSGACPNPRCRYHCGGQRCFQKKGYFVTKWNRQRVPRYRCPSCGRYFSSHTGLATYRQRKPFLNQAIFELYASAVTQRRMARVLRVNRKTVVRKFLFLALQARARHRSWLKGQSFSKLQLDEMESFEHTRLKPLTIALAVNEQPRRIVSVRVASIPYKGKLAAIALKKYGPRKNHRTRAVTRCLKAFASRVKAQSSITTDASPLYPRFLRRYLPNATHHPIPVAPRAAPPARRNPDDPLFHINHVSARIRHDLSRMGRRVWTTTKKANRLQAHLDLFTAYFNGYQIA